MPVAQFAALVSLIPDIETSLKAKGESVPRPKYETASRIGAPVESDINDNGEEGQENKESRRNFEETSEEEE